MLNWLTNFELERISFFLGFISATIVWLVLSRLSHWIPEIKKSFLRYYRNFRLQQTSGVHIAIKNEAFSRAQSNHLGNKLFFLDEVLIEPLFLVQPNIHQEDEKTSFDSEISNSVPFIPDFPFISRNINVPKISITQAIQNSANLVVSGMSGSGKTVALAHLVSCLAKNDTRCGLKTGKIPIYIDVHDLDLSSFVDQTSIELITKLLSSKLPSSVHPKLLKFLKDEFTENNAILIMDGLDELHPNEFDQCVDFLSKVKNEFTDLQIIVTSSTLYFGKLLELDFSPLFVSSWSNQQISSFYSRWYQLWNSEIYKEIGEGYKNPNSLILNWSLTNLRPLTALEYTLYIWGALSGDLSGNNVIDFIQSYIKRLLPDKDVLDQAKIFARNSIETRKYSLSTIDTKNVLFPKLIQSGLLRQSSTNKFLFNHIELLGFTAGLMSDINLTSSDKFDLKWSGTYSYYGYLSTRRPEVIEAQNLLEKDSSIFPLKLLQISYWLKISSQNSTWRVSLIKQLVKIIQDSKISLPIRLRAIAGLVLSNDSSLPTFFRQLFTQNNDLYKQLALFAISCGNRDDNFINELISLSQKTTYPLQKYVSLALSTYDDESAIHELARVLLSGEENVRQLIAESLAFKSTVGEEILKDAVTMDDIVVRRSAVYGLVKLNNLWAIQTIRNLIIQDSQWVIRNAAAQALEYLESDNPYIPERKSSLIEDHWIIEFAGKLNLGVSSPQSMLPILLIALESDNRIDVIKAIQSSVQVSNRELISKMKEILSTSTDQEILNQIFLTLFLLNRSFLVDLKDI
jgi:hypothetical protein